MSKAIQKIENFFLEPASAKPLGVLRIFMALVLLLQAAMLRGAALDFLSSDGFVKQALVKMFIAPHTPRVSWITNALSAYGLNERTCIYGICGLYLLSLIFLGLGLFSRVAVVFTWFIHWMFINTAYSTSYGVDLFAHVFLFYMMWMPIGDALSIDALLKKRADFVSSQARLAIRVLQLHLCIVYLSSGIEKAMGPQWWNGELMWRAVTLPEYAQFNMTWLAFWPLLAKFAGWSTLVLEIGYCIFIWSKRTRRIWVASIVGLHLGIALLLGLTTFGLIMAILTFSIFGISSEPSEAVKTLEISGEENYSWPPALTRSSVVFTKPSG